MLTYECERKAYKMYISRQVSKCKIVQVKHDSILTSCILCESLSAHLEYDLLLWTILFLKLWSAEVITDHDKNGNS